MTEDNIPYALEGHSDLFLLLQHTVYLFQRRNRLVGNAYAFVFMCSLSVELRELSDELRIV